MKFIEHIHEPYRLLLIWQGQESSVRNRRAVAELVRQPDGNVRLRYLTETADFESAQAEGFVNFPAFRKLDQEYHLGVLETFMRRLPPRTRGDYAQYLEQFRLRADTKISDFALLAYTGAKLPGDGFSIIDPLEGDIDVCDVLIEVAGFRHVSKLPVQAVSPGAPVRFEPEHENAHDCNAVAIHLDAQKIGYVPRQQAMAVCKALKQGNLRASIERVNGRPERPLVYLFARLGMVGKHTTLFHRQIG